MDIFGIVAGVVTIASLFFSLWIYMDSKRKKSLEVEKFAHQSKFLKDILNIAYAIASQATLVANMTDRDETTRKEIKHLCVSILSTVAVIQKSIAEDLEAREKWRFGIPSSYVCLTSSFEQNVKSVNDFASNDSSESG